MKKLILSVLVLLPLSLAAQTTEQPDTQPEDQPQPQTQTQPKAKHRFDIGAGLAIPADVFVENPEFPENNTGDIVAGYRYELPSGLSFGVQYGFVFNHKGSADIKIPAVIGSKDSEETIEHIVMTTRYHTINAIVDYKIGPYGPVSLVIGGGGGTQCRYASYSHKVNPGYYWSANIAVYAGLEFFEHLRVTAGHNHDLHVPISALNQGAPYYYVNVGWAF